MDGGRINEMLAHGPIRSELAFVCYFKKTGHDINHGGCLIRETLGRVSKKPRRGISNLTLLRARIIGLCTPEN